MLVAFVESSQRPSPSTSPECEATSRRLRPERMRFGPFSRMRCQLCRSGTTGRTSADPFRCLLLEAITAASAEFVLYFACASHAKWGTSWVCTGRTIVAGDRETPAVAGYAVSQGGSDRHR